MTLASELWDPELDADRPQPDAEVDELLAGAVDLHTHPGPSPFPRRMSILDAARDAATLGFRAIVCKSHHHSMQPDIIALRSAGLADVPIDVYGGIALNRTVGGLNPYAVELALRMGGRVVWFPTISSHAHVDFHHAGGGFPISGVQLREIEPVDVLDEDGRPNAATLDILDVIAAEQAILNCGHLSAAEIDVLVPAAFAAGVTRVVISHPDFIIDAGPEQVASWTRQGAHVEHCLAMVTNPKRHHGRPYEMVRAYLEAVGSERTLFSSDLGQKGNPLPVTAYRRGVRVLLDAGHDAAQIRAMTGGNAAQLLAR
jgi:hypothetical protein